MNPNTKLKKAKKLLKFLFKSKKEKNYSDTLPQEEKLFKKKEPYLASNKCPKASSILDIL
jgi:hypothetical protein